MSAVIAISGSPQKTWNTATLLEHALKGAESVGAKVKPLSNHLDQAISFLIMNVATKKVTMKKISRAKMSG